MRQVQVLPKARQPAARTAAQAARPATASTAAAGAEATTAGASAASSPTATATAAFARVHVQHSRRHTRCRLRKGVRR